MTYGKIIFNKLDKMEVGHYFNKVEYITLLYGDHNPFIHNSFTTMFYNQKKNLPLRNYKSIDGNITRTS